MKLLVIILAAIVLAYLLLQGCWSAYFQWSRRRHHGMTRERFIEHFAGRGWDAEIAGAVFDHFRSQVMSRDFGISPNDEIGPLFNQAEEDIEADFKTILETLGLKEPPDDAWKAWGRPPVKTMEQLVAAIVWASEHQPA